MPTPRSRSRAQKGSRLLKGSLLPLVVLGALASVAFSPATHAELPKETPRPTAGVSYEYPYDGRDVGHPERAWTGRAYVHPAVAADPKKPVPLLVFLHGLNKELLPHRWMGGGNEGDVRRIAQDLVDKKAIPPLVVAGPSSLVEASVTNALTSWPAFDLDGFVEKTRERLQGIATIDPSRILIAGHSGAGCNDAGGLATAVHGKTHLYAAISIDTCMGPGLAQKLLAAPPDTSVVVAWQEQVWTQRPFTEFKRQWKHDLKAATPPPTALRELDPFQVKEGSPHDALVHLTLDKWLPRIFAP